MHTHAHAHKHTLCPCPPLVNVQFVESGLWLCTQRGLTRSRTNRNTSKPMRMFWRNTKVGSILMGLIFGLWDGGEIAAWQLNKCQPVPPPLCGGWLVLVSLCLWWKSENISCMTSHLGWILASRTKTVFGGFVVMMVRGSLMNYATWKLSGNHLTL